MKHLNYGRCLQNLLLSIEVRIDVELGRILKLAGKLDFVGSSALQDQSLKQYSGQFLANPVVAHGARHNRKSCQARAPRGLGRIKQKNCPEYC
jgi:hypothetical protein